MATRRCSRLDDGVDGADGGSLEFEEIDFRQSSREEEKNVPGIDYANFFATSDTDSDTDIFADGSPRPDGA